MKTETYRLLLSLTYPLLLLFALYMSVVLETGMSWDFTHFGVYPLQLRGLPGVLTHPLVHAGFKHLFANTFPLFFLSWCLFYFYRGIAWSIFGSIWVGCGVLLFLIGHPGWHVGASGVIYGLAFFLFFSGLLRKYVPLIAISLLVTFLYGSLVWSMLPQFTPAGVSWEGHLSGAVAGTVCAFAFASHGPQRPQPFAEEEEEEEEIAPEEGDEIKKDGEPGDEAPPSFPKT